MGCCESVLVESPATYPGQRQRPPNNTTNNRATTTTTASAITQQRLQAQTNSSSYQAKLQEKKLAAIHQQQNSAEVQARKHAAVQEKIAALTPAHHPKQRAPTAVLQRNITEYNRRSATYDPAYPPPTAAAKAGVETDPAKFLSQAEQLIPAEFMMISGCEDEQTSMDVGNAASQLPNPKGRAGGACTSNLLELLYDHDKHNKYGNNNDNNTVTTPFTFQHLLMSLRSKIADQGLPQIPQLTSSRPVDINATTFNVFEKNTTQDTNTGGTKRALLIGIKYEGQNGQLNGCANDAYHMRDYLMNVHGYEDHNITLLTDDSFGNNSNTGGGRGMFSGGGFGGYNNNNNNNTTNNAIPTKQRMITELQHLVNVSRPGDSVFFHYSGHGGFLEADQNSFKAKNEQYDQTLIPLDHTSHGQIRDFNLFHHFVRPMARGVKVTCLMDCCHSGSVLDLPYSYQPTRRGEDGGGDDEGQYQEHLNIGDMAGIAFLAVLAGQVLDSIVFEPVIDDLLDTLGEDWEQEYTGILEQELLDDLMEDAVMDTLIDDEIQEAIERQVDDEINTEIEQRIEEELGPQIEEELQAELEEEISAQVEEELAQQMEEEVLQRQAEEELQQQQQQQQQQQEEEEEMHYSQEGEYDYDDGGGEYDDFDGGDFGGGDY